MCGLRVVPLNFCLGLAELGLGALVTFNPGSDVSGCLTHSLGWFYMVFPRRLERKRGEREIEAAQSQGVALSCGGSGLSPSSVIFPGNFSLVSSILCWGFGCNSVESNGL